MWVSNSIAKAVTHLTQNIETLPRILFGPDVYMRAGMTDSLVFHREPALWSPTGHAAGERSETEAQRFDSSLAAGSKNSEKYLCHVY